MLTSTGFLSKIIHQRMEYLLTLISIAAIAAFAKYLCDFVRAMRFHQWKAKRDNLSLEQYVQSLESEYYKAKMKDLYRDKL